MTPLFGPAGNSQSFYDAGYKSTVEAMPWVADIGLSAFEYQCGNGVRLSAAMAEKIRFAAEQNKITLSLHAPYYISLTSGEEQTVQNTLRHIKESAVAVKNLGGNRIVVHTGACGKQSRADAMEAASRNLLSALHMLAEEGHSDVFICLETMGKLAQLGTAEEVAQLCTLSERLIPALDFGHLNARTLGGIRTKGDYESILNLYENALGEERAKRFHCHFSKIEYTAGGEKKHLTFEDTKFGPEFEPLAELIYQRSYTPTLICESCGTQAEDSVKMREIYNALAGG